MKKEKPNLHPRNQHQGRYDLTKLLGCSPELASHIILNKYGTESIDFANAKSVKALNRALLKSQYNINYWDIPPGYLCPPVPGRADYVHHMADLLESKNNGKIPVGASIKCLDIGTGANCIYPIVGVNEYGWSFIGSDIDSVSIESAQKIVESNTFLIDKVDLRLQRNTKRIFKGIIKEGEKIDFSICNPPFHASAEEAKSGTIRKLSNLNKKKTSRTVLNFGGKNNELWCQGGELRFITDIIIESKQFANSCFWFSTLVSKQSNLKSIYTQLKKIQAEEVKTIEMGQGNKTSRVVVWTFLNPAGQRVWTKNRWMR